MWATKRKARQKRGGPFSWRDVLLGDLDVEEAGDHIPAHGAFIGLFLEVVSALPAHAVVPAWQDRCIPRGAEADDAVVACLYILLRTESNSVVGKSGG